MSIIYCTDATEHHYYGVEVCLKLSLSKIFI